MTTATITRTCQHCRMEYHHGHKHCPDCYAFGVIDKQGNKRHPTISEDKNGN